MTMTHDQRMRVISEWTEKVLGHFTPPKGMDEPTQKHHRKMIAKSINRSFPNDMKHETMIVRLEHAEEKLLANAKTRAWPLPAEFLNAVQRRDKLDKGSEVAEFRLERIIYWLKKYNEPAPGFQVSYDEVREMEKRGVATARELYEAGFYLPADMLDRMGGMTKLARERHEQILEDLKATGRDLRSRDMTGVWGPAGRPYTPEEEAARDRGEDRIAPPPRGENPIAKVLERAWAAQPEMAAKVDEQIKAEQETERRRQAGGAETRKEGEADEDERDPLAF